jgi:RDD family protein
MSRLDELDLAPSAAPAASEASRADLLFDGSRAGASAEVAATDSTPLFDLPLSGGDEKSPPPDSTAGATAGRRGGVAPLSARSAALAADAALVLLLTAAPLLGATAGPGHVLAPRGLWWSGAFALYLFFFATVVPLLLFGKTVGMALTGLTARGGPGRPPLTAAEACGRWIGTVLAFAGLGVPLLATRRDPGAPSLADRFSRRPLTMEDV